MAEIERHIRAPQTVNEKWWHRFIRVLMYLSTAIVAPLALFFLAMDPDSYSYSYSYNFESGYEHAEGGEQRCWHVQSDSIDCGEINTLGELNERFPINSLLAKAFNPQNPPGWPKVRQMLIDDLGSGEIRFRQASHWKMEALAKSVALALFISALWYLLVWIMYSIILFIVHGHTRVRKI